MQANRQHLSSDQAQALEPLEGYFPTGAYSFITALSTVSTACTSNPATFRCFPFAAYTAASPNASAATFNWIITRDADQRYVISSSDNPFAPSFANLSMMFLDVNQYNERFVFNFTMAKSVAASAPLSGDPAAATCWFNHTVLSATLWTRARASYPVNISAVPDPRNATFNFNPWPYKVDITQVQVAEPGVPDCMDASGRRVGDFQATPTPGVKSDCECGYTNYGLVAGNRTTSRRGYDR